MITELNVDQFYKCKHFLQVSRLLEVRAVIEGINPGRIFIDNPDNPASALIWLGNNDGFIFTGDETNEKFISSLNDFIDKELAPEAKRAGLKWFEGAGSHPGWNKVLEKICEGRKWSSWGQRVYKLEEQNYVSREPLIDYNYEVMKINKALLDRGNLINNREFLDEKILSFWSSYGKFFEYGIGYCIKYENEIVTICMSDFVAGNIHTIGIETLKKHEGKKLAQKAVHRVVKECFSQGYTPYWDCMESNKPSIAVAEVIGFQKFMTYTGYEFPFN
ncbi:GNAT family N-acetyltransferase [Evansella sp. LMS18]|uniref:GNAT family N-acetyltransferase n=1 Tax=Evansella sp. LMS18 TaxID=2924033 RepID=UPI0020D15855|nr:GNAT family N-acetyltransferase [Evansella sp. LMS18]UTR09987.1 GNAT family N-acetyltransferase [Evansella sp. LMS18]